MSLTAKSEADILSRVIRPNQPEFSADAARSILALSFDSEDVDRMSELSHRAREGSLSADEQEELNSYERVGHLLAILHSKARASLKNITSESSQF